MMNMRRVGSTLAALLLGLFLFGMGLWQVERREWKHDLIAAVDSRINAAPVRAPGPDEWADISQDRHAYLRVTASGTFRHDKEVLTKAVTERGSGYWVMTPLNVGDYDIVINRGFVPADKVDAKTRADANGTGAVTITGLLRLSEPKGGFLRENDPKGNRWFSRDIAMITQAKQLGQTAPYFIDADATPNAGGYPIGGLTVVKFNDHHLIYALTWFGLTGLVFFFAYRIWTSPRRKDKGGE